MYCNISRSILVCVTRGVLQRVNEARPCRPGAADGLHAAACVVSMTPAVTSHTHTPPSFNTS